MPVRPRYWPSRRECMISRLGLKAACMALAVPVTVMLRVSRETSVTLRPYLLRDLVTLSASALLAPNWVASSSGVRVLPTYSSAPGSLGPVRFRVTVIFSLGSTSPTLVAAGSLPRLLPRRITCDGCFVLAMRISIVEAFGACLTAQPKFTNYLKRLHREDYF